MTATRLVPAASAALATLLVAACQSGPAPVLPAGGLSGYLCCNMRSDGTWISDSNYTDKGQKIVAVGTPLKVTGYGRQRAVVRIDGKEQTLANDYSRQVGLDKFTARYVVAQDPRAKLAAMPAKEREAIESARVTRGMTKEQVTMSLGYPIGDENPSLEANHWKYYLSPYVEYLVIFGDDGRVREVIADATTKRIVYVE